ncbi:MAG: DoxX family protein [Bacteriovoracaceae bacterium]
MEFINTLLPILKVLTLSAVFFVWFIRYSNIVEEFKRYGLSPKLRDFVGILKITAVLLIQSNETLHVQIGSALLAFLMLSAFITL